MNNSDPANLPDLTGKIAIITGSNTGIGKATAYHLLKKNAKVYIAARDLSKAQDAIRDIKETLPGALVEALELDLSSFASVKAAAERYKSLESELHILLNNAGSVNLPASIAPDGYDILWTTNYMGHYLFTKLLMPTLLKSARTSKDPVRIVNLTSTAHTYAPSSGIMFEDIGLPIGSAMTRYGHTKLANLLHAKALAKRYGGKEENMIITSVHPGGVQSDMSSRFLGSILPGVLARLVSWAFLIETDKGSWSSLYAAASNQVSFEDNGAYFIPFGKRGKPSTNGLDEVQADKLWTWTDRELANKGY